VGAVQICRLCGDHSVMAVPRCGCDPVDGAGVDALEEGPLWVGPLYDLDAVRGMHRIAHLGEAEELISKETKLLLDTIVQEAIIESVDENIHDTSSVYDTNTMFYRRPCPAAGGNLPKLASVRTELKRRGFKASRTHFCVRSLKSDASVKDFNDAVEAAI